MKNAYIQVKTWKVRTYKCWHAQMHPAYTLHTNNNSYFAKAIRAPWMSKKYTSARSNSVLTFIHANSYQMKAGFSQGNACLILLYTNSGKDCLNTLTQLVCSLLEFCPTFRSFHIDAMTNLCIYVCVYVCMCVWYCLVASWNSALLLAPFYIYAMINLCVFCMYLCMHASLVFVVSHCTFSSQLFAFPSISLTNLFLYLFMYNIGTRKLDIFEKLKILCVLHSLMNVRFLYALYIHEGINV